MDPKQDPIEQIEGLVGKEFSPTTELVEIEVLLERAMGLVKGLPVGRPTRSEDHLEVAPSAAPVSHLERAPFKIR